MTIHKPWCNTGCNAETGEHHVKPGDTISGPGHVPPQFPAPDGGALVTAGGWCAPAAVLTDCTIEPSPIELPTFTVPRGGITYSTEPLSPAEQVAAAAFRAFVERVVARAVERRHAAVERAALEAHVNGWDLHVYNPPVSATIRPLNDEQLYGLNFVGIAFTERERSLPFPMIHEHTTDESWSDWWEDNDA